MLERLNKIRAITDGLLQSRPTLKNDYLETDDWTIIEEMIHLFKPFNEETLILSGASLPSSGSQKNERQIKGTLDSSFKVSAISALLDPSTKSNIIDEADREISLI
ncbi:hypothetical protein F8M41_020916 [Gigaspora margarita]|uniref:Uncharacterized protein n=1 Tax=Gigaspora margarita TaxID=4874 RepID=A0A8H4EJH4_GIGMA|nr:hypothetical protein F8M41_020916 [Gigaspora margarita]